MKERLVPENDFPPISEEQWSLLEKWADRFVLVERWQPAALFIATEALN